MSQNYAQLFISKILILKIASLKIEKSIKCQKYFFMCIKFIPIHIFIYLLIRKIYIKRKIVYDQICPGMLALPHKKNFFETIKKRICLKKIQPIWQMYWDLFQPLYYFFVTLSILSVQAIYSEVTQYFQPLLYVFTLFCFQYKYIFFLHFRVKKTKYTYILWIYYQCRAFSNVINGITSGNRSNSNLVINNYILSILQYQPFSHQICPRKTAHF